MYIYAHMQIYMYGSVNAHQTDRGVPPHPRFGRSFAKVRSLHLKDQRREAATFLREALTGEGKTMNMNMAMATNNTWMTLANLKPVFQYLAKQ